MLDLPVNEEISNREVFVIDENGNKLGIMNRNDAIQRAYDKDLDLVQVSLNSNVATCKILNYGKYKYEMLKKEKENKKKQHVTDVAEVQIGLRIQQHDLEVKAKTIERLISRGDDVRIVLRMNGREVNRPEDAISKVSLLIDMCKDFSKVKKPAVLRDRDVVAIIERTR